MTRLLPLLAVLACAHQARRPVVMPDRLETRSSAMVKTGERTVVNPVVPCVVPRPPIVVRVPCPPIPAEPVLSWMSPACPSQFGACILPEDTKEMARYMHNINALMRAIKEGCVYANDN